MTPVEKIKKAKMQLILSQPFFATLLMPMPIVEDNSTHKVVTNGEFIGYNSEYVNNTSVDNLKGLLCSAIMKVANLHHLRRNGRSKKQWNKATDYAVNPLVKNSGMTLPVDSLISSEYENLSAEKIFGMIPAEPEMPPQDTNAPGDKNNDDSNVEVRDSPAKTGADKQEKEAKIKQQVAQAAQIGKRAGTLPAYLEEIIKDILQPRINWKEVLARFITDIARNDYSFKKPNSRFIQSGFYLPSLYSEEPGNIFFIVDTSGSIDIELFEQFSGELQDACSSIQSKLTVIYVDTKVQHIQEIEPDEKVKLEVKGRGGTLFSPGFDHINEHGLEPEALVYLTDGDCNEYPKEHPDFPVLWAVYGNEKFTPPFGETIPLD